MKRLSIAIIALLSALPLWAQTPDSTAVAGPPVDLPMMDYTRPGRYVVRDVRVHGSRYYDPEMMKTVMGLIPGDSITLPGTYVSEAIRKVWKMMYFSDVQIVTTPEEGSDGVSFDVWLTERPRVLRWTYEGVRKSEATELAENLKLRAGGELSDFVLDKNRYFITKYFSDKGFRNAEVTPRITNDTLRNYVNVAFVVNKGPKVRVGAINITGNEEFTARRLRRTFKKNHVVGWKFWQNSKFKEVEYAEDKELLLDYYNSKGFRNAGVVRDSVYQISPNRLGIDITVEEGNKFYYRNVSWTGNSIYTTEYLNQQLGVERGATYDRKSLHKRLGVGREINIEDNYTITALYQNQGYLMSSIEPSEIIVGADSLDLDIKIFEGEKFTINNVQITGNNRVNDGVIRREIDTYPGELYSRQLVMSTIYRLGGMGHFDPSKVAPGIQPVTNSLVDISWNLEEQPSDKVDISGGWGAGMFVGSVGVQLNNFSIFFKKGSWRPYPQGQNQQLAIRGQSNGSYYKALSASFTEPWLGGRKPHSLTLSGYYSAESNAMYIYQTGTAYFRTLGISAGIGFRLNWPDRYFSLYTELGYQRYMPKDWDYFSLMKNGNGNVVTFRTVFGRSSIANPIFPSYGSDFSLSVTLTPPWSLMDGKDYSDPNMSDQERNKMIEYHKWMFKGRMFTPLTTGDKPLVLMAKAEFGYLGHYNPNKLSPFEGFRVGGDGMQGYTMYGEDIIGMRGYDDMALVPAELQTGATRDRARVYTKYTLELRYPFLQQGQTNIYGLVFAEAGNGYASWKTFNPFQVKRSLGAGVRIMLPMVGLLGFDWGWGFDVPAMGTKRAGGKVSFTMGQEF